jgi:hypothetical protein
MPIAVVILLSDEGQVSVGEVDAAMVTMDELEPVEDLDAAFGTAQTLLVGDEPPAEIEEEAFTQAAESPVDPMMAEEEA